MNDFEVFRVNVREDFTLPHSLLAGRIVDASGESLIASDACKAKVRYRYYVKPRSPDHTGCRRHAAASD